MQEEITATVQLIYSCPAEQSLTAQSAMIHDDVVRLLDADSANDVALSGFTIQHVQSEAMTYGNTEPRNACARQADRVQALLDDAYPDAGSIAEAMSYALCDLRHLADAHNIAFGLWDKTGHSYYVAERHDADHKERKAALQGPETDQGERS